MKQEPADSTAADHITGESQIRHCWHVFRERQWLAITAFISVFFLLLIYLFKATEIYLATTTLEIDQEPNNIVNLGGQGVSLLNRGFRDRDYLETQHQKILGRTLIKKVMRQLRLDKKDARSKNLVEAIRKDIDIVPNRLSRLVNIEVQHPNGEQAARIANTLANLFLETNRQCRKDKFSNFVSWLQEEVEIQEGKIQDAARAVYQFRFRENNGENNVSISFEGEQSTA